VLSDRRSVEQTAKLHRPTRSLDSCAAFWRYRRPWSSGSRFPEAAVPFFDSKKSITAGVARRLMGDVEQALQVIVRKPDWDSISTV
jgi:hypothetical protein